MARKTRVLLVCAVAGLLAQPMFAQDWRDRIDAALAAKATYDFREMAVADVARTISTDSGVNVVLDSSPFFDPARKLTFKLNKMSYDNVLTWFSRLAGAEWVIQDEAVFIAPLERIDAAGKLQIERRNQNRRAQAEKTWFPQFREVLSQPRGVDFKGKRLQEAADSLAALFDLNILLSPEVDGRIQLTLSVSEMTGENIIAWVARKAGIDYAVLDEAVYLASVPRVASLRAAGLDFSSRARPYQLVTFDFENTPLDEALSELANQAGVEIVLRSGPGALPSVTLKGADMSLMAAVQAVTRATGLNTAIVAESGTIIVSVLAVAPPLPLPNPPAPEAPREESGPAENAPGAQAPSESSGEAPEAHVATALGDQ